MGWAKRVNDGNAKCDQMQRFKPNEFVMVSRGKRGVTG